MSSDLSGEITAIATAVLAAFAIITAIVAYVAFRKQTQEVGILQQQMKEQQDVLVREARERHKAQASRVFMSQINTRHDHPPESPDLPEPDSDMPTDTGNREPPDILVKATVVNTSDQPIYDAGLDLEPHPRSHQAAYPRYT